MRIGMVVAVAFVVACTATCGASKKGQRDDGCGSDAACGCGAWEACGCGCGCAEGCGSGDWEAAAPKRITRPLLLDMDRVDVQQMGDHLSRELRVLRAIGRKDPGFRLLGKTSVGHLVVAVPFGSEQVAPFAGRPPRRYERFRRFVIRYSAAEFPGRAVAVARNERCDTGKLVLSRSFPRGITPAELDSLDTPDVERLEPNYELRTRLIRARHPRRTWKTHFPLDPSFDWVWGKVSVRAPSAWAVRAITPIVVAVIDTGVDLQHEDLRLWENPDPGAKDCYPDDRHGWDFVDDDNDPMDEEGHGTHCAGTIGAVSNEKGVAGVGWGTQIMALRFLEEDPQKKELVGSAFNACRAIYYAVDHGARVINASWGFEEKESLLEEAVRYADKKDVVVVASAGNVKTGHTGTMYPAAYRLDNVIAVFSIARNDTPDPTSRLDGLVHLGAPGRMIYSTEWYTGRGPDQKRYDYRRGTSMAAPFVSGAAALVLGFKVGARDYTGLTPKKLRKLLVDQARPFRYMTPNGIERANVTLDLSFLAR